MNIKFYTSLFLLVTSLLFSCKSAEKSFARGNYDEAVNLAIKKMSRKGGDPTLADILIQAYQQAVSIRENNIRSLSSSNDPLRFERVLGEYNALQNLYNRIQRSPAALQHVKPADYSSYLNTYREEAGNVRYDRAMQLMQRGDKASYREAYNELQKALQFMPGDISIKNKMDEAFAKAVTYVTINSVTRYSDPLGYYYNDFAALDRNILQYLQQNNNNRFLQFVPANGGLNYQPDHVIDSRFRDVIIGRPIEKRTVKEVSKQVVAKEIVYSKDSVIKEYITVKAKVTTTHISLRTYGILQTFIRDEMGRVIFNEDYRGEYNWASIHTTYTGDERALSEEDKKLIDREPQRLPPNEHILRIILGEIQEKASCGIMEFYKRRYW